MNEMFLGADRGKSIILWKAFLFKQHINVMVLEWDSQQSHMDVTLVSIGTLLICPNTFGHVVYIPL